jgi:hypothetical protein
MRPNQVSIRPVDDVGRGSRSRWRRRSGRVAPSSSAASRTSNRSASTPRVDHSAASSAGKRLSGSRTRPGGPDRRFQAAASYSLISPPRIGRRRALPWISSGTGVLGWGGRRCSARCGRRVRSVLGKHPAKVPLPEDQHAIGELGADGQHEAFGEAVRPGQRGGILTIVMPASARTASQAVVNCPARSRTRNRKPAVRSPRSMMRLRACWVVQGPSGWPVSPARADSGGGLRVRTRRRACAA